MTTINLEANVKNLVTSTGLSFASSGNTVTLSINNSGLAQILSQILQSSATVTVNYNASTGKISFTSTGGGSGGGGGGSGNGVPPLIITNKNQFDSSNEIYVGLNQDVFLLATNTADWEPVTYTLNFPNNVSEPSKHFLFFENNLPSNSNVEFATGNLNANHSLNSLSNQVLMVVITPSGLSAIYGSLLYLSP